MANFIRESFKKGYITSILRQNSGYARLLGEGLWLDGSYMTLTIHDCLIGIEKRAERADEQKLTETFVDAAPLLASVVVSDHQVIFGRRGTGKTHLLKYLHDQSVSKGDISIYMDLRIIGSNNSIYSDQEKSHAQRATPLLLDVLQNLHETLCKVAIDNAVNRDLSLISPKLDALAEAISAVEVVGSIETTDEDSSEKVRERGSSLKSSLSSSMLSASLRLNTNQKTSNTAKTSTKRSGSERFYVKFGSVQSALKDVVGVLGNHRVWLLLDEWSEIPYDIQPYLADLLRRCVIPLAKITVKIAAIEHRSNFSVKKKGEYLGIELGADAGGDVNLDDFMVFDNDATRAISFFSDLLFKHYRATDGLSDHEGAQTSGEFIKQTFTQVTALEEFVRAVEGVPRDAVYLASTVARRAYGRSISVQDVRAAARDWYTRDKASVLRAEPALGDLLQWIIEEVIAHRRARAFLLVSHENHPLIETLFDSRLLHVLKKNISSHDNPGVRYDVYKLDYGCYVDLINSSRAPGGLIQIDDDDVGYIDVPPDDYRSIRRAILDLAAFETSQVPTED